MRENFYFRKITTQDEFTAFWSKKRDYEKNDISPNLEDSGKELDEIISWFQSNDYYNIIMDLHDTSPENGNGLQFVFIYNTKNEYVGFTMYMMYTQEDGKCFILDFCIEKEYRNSKIGTQVFEYFE